MARDRDFDAALYGFFEFSETTIPLRFNIAPTQLDVFGSSEEGTRRLVASRWGLIPAWARERGAGSRMFNARAETLTERPAFRGLVKAHRCIIPASGFYEWQQSSAGKVPHYIYRRDGAPLALAGLWTRWEDEQRGETVTSHTIITCAPNAVMARLHDRMPVVLDGDALEQWLDPDLQDQHAVLPLLVPCADDLITAHPVSPLVNSTRNDGPELIAPVADDGAAPAPDRDSVANNTRGRARSS